MCRCRVVGVENASQLGFDGLLILEKPVPVTGERFDFGQQRGRRRQRPPVTVFVTERVGKHERVEAVILARRDPVALAGTRRDAWRHREHGVPERLQVLDQKAFGSLDRDGDAGTETAELSVEIAKPRDVVSYANFALFRASRIDNAELVM